MSSNDLMTVEEVAELLRLSPRTVQNKTSAGLIPSVKVAGSRRYERKAIDELIAAGREERVAS